MDCAVIRDLIPLYLDDCCSEESRGLVEAHLALCPSCRALCSRLRVSTPPLPVPPARPDRVRAWRASILQSLLLFASFALLTVGVALEAATPAGDGNGRWALLLAAPAAGLLLSLANWYFVPLYQSRRRFSTASFLISLGISLGAFFLFGLHYGFAVYRLSAFPLGLLLTAALSALSGLLSRRYAGMLGKE